MELAQSHYQEAVSLLEARNEEAAGEPAAALAFYEKAEASLSGAKYVSTPLQVCRERIAALKLEIAQ